MRKKEKYLMLAERHERAGDFNKAREFYEKCLKGRPSEKIHERLGLLLKRNEDIVGAKEHLVKALSLNPNNITCIYNLGIIERVEGRHESSMEKYIRLKKMGVNDPAVDMSLGVLFSEMGEPSRALKHYVSAMEKDKNDTLIFNYSLCLMTLGDYKEGLRLYEHRIWHARPPGEEWRGEDDVNLLISPEQGNGDIIQFSRYMQTLRKRCRKITLLCNAPLVRLMRSVQGVDEVVEFNPGDEFVQVDEGEEGESVPYGKFLRIMSIPHALGLNPPDVNFERYIFADKEKVADFGKKMRGEKLRVGLCWQGGKRNNPEMISIDKRRSIPLSEILSPIGNNEEIEFYSLQKGDDQNREFPFVVDLMNESEDFADTAAMVENLDLVITVDTAIAHLAASMNKPTWMLSRKGGCWRWGVDGESTFWYPSMRIFRQEKMNCWKSAILKMAEELKKFVRVKNGPRS